MSTSVNRIVAVALPFALVLGSAGTASAAKPPRTPVPTVTQKPTAITNLTTATFAWNTPASPTSYTCSLDGAAAVVCTSPKSYPSLTDRLHSFVLKAALVSPSNAKASATSYSWRVDTVAPSAPTVAPIAGPTSNTSATVSFSDADTTVTGYTCALDGAVATACSSPKGYTLLSEATHTVVVVAQDAAGNSAASSVQWVVDHTAPNIPDVVPPASPTKSTSASVAFASGDPAATYTCALDGTVASACVSPWTDSGLAEGSHTLVVTPSDAAANVGTPGTATWVVDLTAPAVPVLISAPAALTSLTDGEVRFADLDLSAVTFSCVLDGGAAAPCTSPFAAPAPLGTGSHTLAVTALDLAGNESAALTAGWIVDTSSFPAQFVSGPSTPTRDTIPAFDFLATDTTSTGFLCSLDGSVYSACTAGQTFAAATEGTHTLSVASLDDAVPANASEPVTWSWVLDTTGPSSAPNAGTGAPADSGPVSSTPTFTFATTDPTVAGLVCSVDGAAFTPCASGYQPPVGDGPHTLVVATVDQAGNVSTSTLTYVWTLDTTAPLATPSVPATLVAPTKVTFSEAVGGATGTALRLGGTTTTVASRQACLDAANGAVACSLSSVRAVVLTPVARLVPGQKYVVVVPGVHDAAGNLATITATPFRALRAIQETNAGMAQPWATRSTTSALGSRYLTADLKGAVATYSFRGTSVVWYTTTGRSMGTARVYVDGVYKRTVNNYSATTHWRVPRSVTGLRSANHTLKIVATGLKGSTAGTGTSVVLDAVKVGTTTVKNPLVSTRWATVATSAALGGRYAVADQAGTVVTMSFRGTSVSWYTVTGKRMGRAKVYVDGVLKGTYDNYAAATHFRVKRTWKLTDKVHTIKIVVLGTHRAAATGSRVAIDGLYVG